MLLREKHDFDVCFFSAYQSIVYESIGHWVVFAVTLSFLEAVHAFLGMVKSNWIVSLVQVRLAHCLKCLASSYFIK